MNKKGHPATLVASHPGNTNAGKTGVYSPRMLSPRVAEIEDGIADRSAAELRREIIRHDLAGLWALLEAVDAAFADRVVNSRNQAKDLLAIRLRLSKTIRAAAEEYEAACRVSKPGAAVAARLTDEELEEVRKGMS
jgi:hypothetical protein